MQRFIELIRYARPGWIGLFLGLAFSTSTFAQTGTGDGHLVTLVQPTNGASYPAPASIQLIAKVNDYTGAITNVSFYAGTSFIGKGVMAVLDPPGVNGVTGPVFIFTWTNVPAGSYSLTAVAQGAAVANISYTSAPVNITVGPVTPAPVVRISSPANHAVFFQPSDIPLFAFATDVAASAAASLGSNSYIANVEFFAGTNDLGSGTHVVVAPPNPILPIELVLPNEFTLVWTNPPAGPSALEAVATDGYGNTATSAPVNITIVPAKIITNGVDVVSIVASDPVAVEGTNCWVWPGLPVTTPAWSSWRTPTPPPACVPFTNCGPKDATFTVRRAGGASNSLTVLYGISGTASNGVDYAMLPGAVTIPAGESYAFINVVPLNTNNPAATAAKTVALTLENSPELDPPADYIIGFPASAAAIIVDSIKPRPPTGPVGPVTGPLFHLNGSGPDGTWFCVEASADLVRWTPISTNQVVEGSIDFVDPNGMAGVNGYYRAVPLLTAPPQ